MHTEVPEGVVILLKARLSPVGGAMARNVLLLGAGKIRDISILSLFTVHISTQG